MVNKRQKGMRHELAAKKLLESQGWIVYRVPGSTMWNRDVDMFHLFDLFCMNKEKQMKLIQVKSSKPNFDKFIEFKEKYCAENVSVEIWIKENRKEFRKEVLKNKSTKEVEL